MTTQPDRNAEVLRLAGFGEAADLLQRLGELEQPEANAEAKPEQDRQPAATTAEEARQREGEALLGALYRSVPSLRPAAQGSDER